MPALETVHADATFRIVISRNVQANVWSNASTVEQMCVFGRVGSAHARRHPSGSALLNVIVSGTPSSFRQVKPA